MWFCDTSEMIFYLGTIGDGYEVENHMNKAIVVAMEPYGIHWLEWVMLWQMYCVLRESKMDALVIRLHKSQYFSYVRKPCQGIDHLKNWGVEKGMHKIGRHVTMRKGRLEWIGF